MVKVIIKFLLMIFDFKTNFGRFYFRFIAGYAVDGFLLYSFLNVKYILIDKNYCRFRLFERNMYKYIENIILFYVYFIFMYGLLIEFTFNMIYEYGKNIIKIQRA